MGLEERRIESKVKKAEIENGVKKAAIEGDIEKSRIYPGRGGSSQT